MNFFGLFKPAPQVAGTAPAARERLQILLSHERALAGHDDLITLLRDEVIKAIAKHVSIEPDKVDMKMNCGDSVSTLVIDIEIPRETQMKLAKTA